MSNRRIHIKKSEQRRRCRYCGVDPYEKPHKPTCPEAPKPPPPEVRAEIAGRPW